MTKQLITDSKHKVIASSEIFINQAIHLEFLAGLFVAITPTVSRSGILGLNISTGDFDREHKRNEKRDRIFIRPNRSPDEIDLFFDIFNTFHRKSYND